MPDIEMLWPHQLKTYEFGKNRDIMMDTSAPGTGKTICHLKLGEKFLEEGGSRIVVACPKVLVRSAWADDARRFCPEMTVALAEAPAANREAAFSSKSDLVVLNTDGLTWLAGLGKRKLRNWLGKKAMLICDESHQLKNPQAQRTKAAMKISDLFELRHNTSGTPAPNSVTELWTQAKILDGGQRMGKRYTVFRNLVQHPEFKGGFINWVDNRDAPDIAYGLLSDIIIGHAFDDVMINVPDMDHRVMFYDLTKRHRKLYEQLFDEAYLEQDGKKISAVNAAALANKLLQCASGATYHDPDGKQRTWSIIDAGRYELIGELVENRPHSVVFFLWHHQRDELIKEFKRRKLSYEVIDGTVTSSARRKHIIDNMQAGKYRVLLSHPNTGAHGLTLTKATTVIFASPVYESKLFGQGVARIRRGEQDLPTESIVILARDTRDMQAYEVFTGKRDRMTALNNLFQEQR